MKYYSEPLKKVFDTEAELVAAEKENEEKLAVIEAQKAEKKAAAQEVENAYKAANEALKVANDKLAEFNKKYGAFHTSVTNASPTSKSLLDFFFDSWMF